MQAVSIQPGLPRHRTAPPAANQPDDLERAAGYGQWCYDPQTGHSLLSPVAAENL